jgi:hypothetical protein
MTLRNKHLSIIGVLDDADPKLRFALCICRRHSVPVHRAIRARHAIRADPAEGTHMKTQSSALYDNSLAGILARLTHGILHDANDRVQNKGVSPAIASPTAARAMPARIMQGWLDRLDIWFWTQEMKHRDAFLARSIDIFDLEQRMRCLERGDKWLGTNRL